MIFGARTFVRSAEIMKILVLNCGSSSLKFQLIETSLTLIESNREQVLTRGSVENIGTAESSVFFATQDSQGTRFSMRIADHREAIRTVLSRIVGRDKVVEKSEEIDGVGHRVVHGGEQFVQSAVMDEPTVKQIEKCSELAPLHNPHNLEGFYAARKLLPHVAHVAVFDTSFHQTLAPHAYLYALPYGLYTRYGIRRYGFHGTSHRYVSDRLAQLLSQPSDACKLITCHLGNGCSICAIDRGRPVDTSMGFTPLEGLVMGTRSGDVDAAAVLYVMTKEKLSNSEAARLLNESSGLDGLSGISGDMRDLLLQRTAGNLRAALAIDVFCYRVKKYIGAYLAVLGGADAIGFTGGIGENAPAVRAQICAGLENLGIAVDEAKNTSAIGAEMDISLDGAQTRVWTIPTNEELLIARDTMHCILETRR